MSDIVISTKEKEETKADINDIKDTLKAADEYQKLKEMNDKLEREMQRTQDILKAQAQMGGHAFAGNYKPELTEKEKADIEAKEILKMFQ